MNKLIVMSLAVATTAFAFAQAAKPTAPAAKPGEAAKPQLTQEQKKQIILEKTGGFIDSPKSFKGKVAIINTQSVVPEEAIKSAATRITLDSQMNFEYQKTAAADPAQLLKDSQAVAAVIVVNDEKAPAALIALEDGWAVVNVAKLDRNLKTDAAKAKFVPIRTTHEISRCATIICGGYRSQFKGNILDVPKFEDLDLIQNGGIPMDRVMTMVKVLTEKGLTRRQLVPYRKACMEGWAPQPTNSYQKAIWDQTHELPTKPIKIKYDAKKGE